MHFVFRVMVTCIYQGCAMVIDVIIPNEDIQRCEEFGLAHLYYIHVKKFILNDPSLFYSRERKCVGEHLHFNYFENEEV